MQRLILKVMVVFLAALFMNVDASYSQDKNGRELVEKMVESVGGRDNLYALRDVEYKYTYRADAGKADVSIERYVFDGELSWGRYLKRENVMFPDLEGEIIQGYDGSETWVTLDGRLLDDPKLLRMADFTRKTNYYWFTMMFKLMDPGVNHEYQGTKNVDGVVYDLVKVTFDEGVGDVQDIYVLYINPETHLVDQFLFTVMDFEMKEPSLMRVEYEEVQGLKLPARRKYTASDWDATIKKDAWTHEICEDIKFDNGFEREMFEKPSS